MPLPLLPRRPRDAHKGDFGRVLVLAGSPRMTGAAVLAGEAALRAGAGLVTLGVPASVHAIVASRVLCETTLPLPFSRATGGFSRAAAARASAAAGEMSAVAIGPGIGLDAGTRAFVRALLPTLAVPHVIDADALNALADGFARNGLVPSAAPRVLTPHPGEMARLLGLSTAAVQADRAGAARRAAKLARGVVVLKGHRSVVTDGERVALNRTGNPGMATGGTGDVLTGVVAALLGQGLSAFDSARLGAHVHGLAGDIAAAVHGETSLIASDLLLTLGAAFERAARGRGPARR